MARRSTNQAPAGEESNQVPAPSGLPEGQEGSATEAAVAEEAVSETASAKNSPIPDASPPDSEASGMPPAGDHGDAEPEKVMALVLHDSIYGKCGEVREFAADQVDALRGAGYIDPHPNAVASAGS